VNRLPVTIVISALNEGKSLAETINSIGATTDLPQEIVVVDDGSIDGCCDELPNNVNTSPMNIVLVTQKRLGISGARNVGASIAKQPFLVFLDAHCLVHSGWLASLVDVIETGQQNIVGPAVRDRNEPDYIGCGARLVGRELRYEWNPVQNKYPTEIGIIPGGCMALSRELFENIGGFDTMRHYGFEDVEFSLRAWRLGTRLLGVPASRIEHWFRTCQPFEVPYASFTYNAIRTAVLHLTGERLKDTLHALSRHPDFMPQMIDLLSGDIFTKKSVNDHRACRDIQEYFAAFG
jgi:GT2 family glycosyltransferase